MLSGIKQYFPTLSATQYEQFAQLPELYTYWNQRINVISRKDIDNLIPHHILHSLAIACFLNFTPQTQVCDVGTGGGFPGIPLAIMFPNCHFVLSDSIGKKIKVVQEIAQAIGLSNVTPRHSRAEQLQEKFHFIVSRAAMPMPLLVAVSRKIINTKLQTNPIPNGIIALKGGDLTQELLPYRNKVLVEDITTYMPEDHFHSKKIVYLPL